MKCFIDVPQDIEDVEDHQALPPLVLSWSVGCRQGSQSGGGINEHQASTKKARGAYRHDITSWHPLNAFILLDRTEANPKGLLCHPLPVLDQFCDFRCALYLRGPLRPTKDSRPTHR